MGAPLSEPERATADLVRIAGQIDRLEELAKGWDEHHAGTLLAIKTSIADLNR